MQKHKLLVIAVLVVFSFCFALISGSSSQDKPEVASEKKPVPSFQKELQKSEKAKNKFGELLKNISNGDEEANEIYKFYLANSVFVDAESKEFHPHKPIPAEYSSPLAFKIFPSDMHVRRTLGLRGVNHWMYDHLTKILTVPIRSEWEFTEIWAGAIFFHELRHAYDMLTGLEEMSATNSDVWLEGEVRAYSLEIRLLDKATNGKFIEILDAAVSRGSNRGWLNCSRETRKELDGLFPPQKSPAEKSLRLPTYIIALNFRAVESGKLEGKTRLEFLRDLHN